MHNNRFSIYWGVVFLLLLASCQDGISVIGEPSGTSSVAVLEADQTNYKLREFVQVLADSAEGYTIDDILQPTQQAKFKIISDEPLVTSNYQYYWGKIQVENRLPEAQKRLEWVLSFSSTWTNLDVFTIGKDGNWELAPNGSFTPDHLKEFKPTARGNLIKLFLLPGQVETVYFRGISERKAINPTFHAFLQPLDIFFAKLLKEKVNNAIFIGFLLMMLFYNLIVYFFGRDRSFLFYSGYLLMVVVYACYSSDDLADWFGNLLFPEHPAYYSFFKLSIYLGLICYLAFIRSFLDLEQLLAKWDRYFKVVISLGFLLMGLYVVVALTSNFSYVLEDQVTVVYIGLVVLSCVLLIYPLYKTKDTKGYFVVVGIAVISLGCLLTLASRLLPTPYSIFYLKAAAVIEILIFSLGLAYRQRQQVQAREQADFALKESQLIQEKKQLEADRLQELNDFKTRFYTNITHEFRTPLTVIMGMSENIKDHPQEKKLIQRNSANLLRLINQLLDLSKLESGSLVLQNVHQDIIVYLQYLTESFYSNATQKNIRLVFYSEEKEVMMDYDEEKILQIIYNLLSNALKFTQEDGRIVFHASKIEEEGQPVLKLKVKDNGQGISPADLPHIFDRFYQVNNTDFRQAEGTGIGLALTKELVDLMNGRIEVESELGVGTEFLLYLPMEAQLPATKSTARFGNKESEDLAISSMQADDQPSAIEIADSELPELLIIEDNEDIITYIKTVLSGQYVFHTAKNGVVGIEKAFEIIPDIIISDVMMPEKNGYEVCETLKQDERTSHIPIVLLTAKSTQEDKIQGLKFGADAYLTKPFDKEELVIRLEKLVTIRQQLQMRYANTIAPSSISPSIDDVFLDKLHEQIQSHLRDTEFGVPQLAEAAQLSQMQLYRKLKGLTGKTPSQFIRAYRLRQALLLLEKGELTISEIAYEVGFADPSYFSRMFQKEFKKNPSDYFK